MKNGIYPQDFEKNLKSFEKVCPGLYLREVKKAEMLLLIKIRSSSNCKVDKLYENELWMKQTLYFVEEIRKEYAENCKGVHLAIWDESLCPQETVVNLLQGIDYTRMVVLDTLLVDKKAQQKGPCLVYKDGNFVAAKEALEMAEEVARRENFSFWPFVGYTDKSLASLYCAKGVKHFVAVKVPLLPKKGKGEEISLKDIEKTRNFLLKYETGFAIIK